MKHRAILFAAAGASLLTGCAPKGLVYSPGIYGDSIREIPVSVKVVEMADRSPEWTQSDGNILRVMGRFNMAKGGQFNWSLPPLTPNIMTDLLLQELKASRRFKSAQLVPAKAKPGRDEIVLSGDIHQATWDCPDGPLSDSCVFRFDLEFHAEFASGAVWKRRVKTESPANYGKHSAYKFNTAKTHALLLTALNTTFGRWIADFAAYLSDPVARELNEKSPSQVRAAIPQALSAEQWRRAFALAVGSDDSDLLDNTCAALGQGPSGGEEARTALIQGGALAKKSRYDEAIERYDAAIAAGPGDKTVYFNRALVLGAREDYPAAIVGMRCFIAMRPDAQALRKAKDKIAAWEALAQ